MVPTDAISFCFVIFVFSIFTAIKFCKYCCEDICYCNNSLGRPRSRSGKYWDEDKDDDFPLPEMV